MSGFLEVLGAVSAALSVLKASKTVIEAIQERREFEGHVDRALAVAGTLRWRWDSLSAYLEEARRDGLDDSRLAEHASTMEKKLGEASELVRGLLNRGGTAANVKILLGFGAGRLQRLRFCLEQLVDDLQTMEMVFLGWVLRILSVAVLTIEDGAPQTCGGECPAASLFPCPPSTAWLDIQQAPTGPTRNRPRRTTYRAPPRWR
jgi:hypothetical protein